MKNNRKIRVGQVRQIKGCEGLTNQYTILSLKGNQVSIMWVNGKMSGIKEQWHFSNTSKDFVVM
jgi:hypothetical protein